MAKNGQKNSPFAIKIDQFFQKKTLFSIFFIFENNRPQSSTTAIYYDNSVQAIEQIKDNVLY